jgi:uncharacterized protein
LKLVFADTVYWVALINPNDEWRNQARSATTLLTDAQIITTDSILIEVLNFFAEHGDEARRRAVSVVEQLLTNPIIEVVPQTHDNFLAGLTFYKARADKGYSLTDCVSMITMRDRSITEVLTHDRHFGQEGFTVLF